LTQHPQAPRTRRQRLALAAALALAALAPAPGGELLPSAQAAAYDPALRWRSMETEHFTVTFHEGLEPLAKVMGEMCDEVYESLVERWGTDPKRRVELVLVDWTDSANGYATPLPVNTIVIYVTAPTEASTLNYYDDWNRSILTHELTHILHLDTVEGLPRVARLVFGRIVSMNLLSPGWITEGIATWTETELTAGGRGRASEADMIKRMTTLEGHFPPLGNLEGFQSDPPYGNLRYLFGQDFIQYIAEQQGHDTWREWIHGYGRWIVPYWLPAKRIHGESYRSLYKGWRAEAEERYAAVQAQIEAEGLTESTLLSDGESACSGPRFSPDGELLVYGCNSRKQGPGIWLASADGAEPRRLYDETSPHNFTWRADGRAFAFSSAHAYDVYYSFQDLYLYDLDSDSLAMLTERARARDPEFSPDGRDLLAITNEAQVNDLTRFSVGGLVTPLTEHRGHVQLSTPRFSPDGQRIALTMWRDGQRDLWLASPDGAFTHRLTDDMAVERDPAWSPDGRVLYFVSDRTGVSNIYALELDTAQLWQVTNVLGGAFQPDVHPSGESMVFAEFTWNGADIRLLELDRTQWKDVGVLEPARVAFNLPGEQGWPQPYFEPQGDEAAGQTEPATDARGVGLPSSAASPLPAGEEAVELPFPTKPYNPLPTLLPPRFLSPGFYIAEYGGLASLGTSGADVLRHWGYSGYLNYRTDNRFVGGGGSVTLNRWRTVMSAGGSVSSIRYGNIYTDPGAPEGGGAVIPGIERSDIHYYDKRVRSWAQASYPLGRRQYLFARYNGTLRSNLYELPEGAYLGTLPTRGFLPAIGGGWRYTKTQSYAHSVSAEKGRTMSLVGQITSSAVGAYTLGDDGSKQPFDQAQISAEWREYTSMPWLGNHVLASKLAIGLSSGDNLRYGSFRLGGSYGEGSVYMLPEEYRSLRGFPVGASYGDLYYLGSLEYRAPIWRIDRGFQTWPFFLRTLHGALYCDAGYAFDAFPASGAELGSTLSNTLVGVGAELRLNMVVGWGMGLTTRLGYGFGVNGAYGYVPGSLDGFYAQLGSSF
jgi:hypothetical protein